MDRRERETGRSPWPNVVQTCTIAIIFVLQLAGGAVVEEILRPQPGRAGPAPKSPLEEPELWGTRAERLEQILTNCVLKTARRLAEHDAHMPALGIVETAFNHCTVEETALRLHIVTGLSSLSRSAMRKFCAFGSARSGSVLSTTLRGSVTISRRFARSTRIFPIASRALSGPAVP